MRGTGLLAVPSESNDLREQPSNRSTGEKGAGAAAIRCLTLSFLHTGMAMYRETKPLRLPSSFVFTNISLPLSPSLDRCTHNENV